MRNYALGCSSENSPLIAPGPMSAFMASRCELIQPESATHVLTCMKAVGKKRQGVPDRHALVGKVLDHPGWQK